MVKKIMKVLLKIMMFLAFFALIGLVLFVYFYAQKNDIELARKNQYDFNGKLVDYSDLCDDYSDSIIGYANILGIKTLDPCACDGDSIYDFKCDLSLNSLCKKSGGTIKDKYDCRCPEGQYFSYDFGCMGGVGMDCRDIEDDARRTNCLVDKVVYTDDIEVCREAVDGDFVGCICGVVESTGYTQYCNELDSEIDYDFKLGYANCLKSAAKFTGKPEDCSIIKDNLVRDECYLDLSKLSDDDFYCNRIIHEDKRDACLFLMAEKYNKRGLCDEIISQKVKDDCKKL